MNSTKYPIYVISKGRWEERLTAKSLEKNQIHYRIVIEPQEYDQYAAVIDPKKILVLPFSNLGQGSIPARNWVWEHSIQEGHNRHWILDDNIRQFYRLNNNQKIRVYDSTPFKVCEDFTDRYLNVPMSGLQYAHLLPRRQKFPPFDYNTRIYSCILLSNTMVKHRWRGRYNEDTDLSLRILKDGWATLLIQAFLCDKQATMESKGGNTDELYRQDSTFDGRYEMAKSLYLQHPDVVNISRRWGRWQHIVNYRPFKRNKLIRKKDVTLTGRNNNYGLKLKKTNCNK
tara:strand:+ start:827 stop:1681 length:855 start_codon:yes stop_codon:yes gene_type:complete